jgi:hypothetical protein
VQDDLDSPGSWAPFDAPGRRPEYVTQQVWDLLLNSDSIAYGLGGASMEVRNPKILSIVETAEGSAFGKLWRRFATAAVYRLKTISAVLRPAWDATQIRSGHSNRLSCWIPCPHAQPGNTAVQEITMRKLASFVLGLVVFATPLFAAKQATVHIRNDVTVGSTQIPAGKYKLTYQGPGPAVTVTLTDSWHTPIVLNATVVHWGERNASVAVENKPNGERVLIYIDLGGTTLHFDQTPPADQSPAEDQ